MKNYILLYGDKKPEDNICLTNMFERSKPIHLGWTDFDYNHNMNLIQEEIKNGIEQIIFAGLEIGWDRMIEAIKKDYPNVNLIQVIIDTPSDENEATAKSALEEAGATFDSIIPNTSLANWVVSNLEGLPTTVFVDKDGVLLGDQIQGTQTKDGYMSAIEKVLDNLES